MFLSFGDEQEWSSRLLVLVESYYTPWPILLLGCSRDCLDTPGDEGGVSVNVFESYRNHHYLI